MAKVQNFDEVNRKNNLEDVLIVGNKRRIFTGKITQIDSNKKEWVYSEEWAIFCSVIQQSIEETPLILGENLLDTEIIKDLEIANNQRNFIYHFS